MLRKLMLFIIGVVVALAVHATFNQPASPGPTPPPSTETPNTSH